VDGTITIDLRAAQRQLRQIGGAYSLFQANPPRTDSDPGAKSDWGRELVRKLNGLSSHILHDKPDAAELPQMLSKMPLYVNRSKALGLNAFRFSFEFCELSPSIGEFNNELMLEYVKLILLARLTGHEPMVTLHHYTNPLSLVRIGPDSKLTAGAWEHPEIIGYLRFVLRRAISFLMNKDRIRQAIRELGIPELQAREEEMVSRRLVKWFVTINEPIMSVSHSYLLGLYPPFKKGALGKMLRVRKTIRDAHRMMYQELKALYGGSEIQVGMAYNGAYYQGLSAPILHWLCNKWGQVSYFEGDGSFSDFLAWQYYFAQKGPNSAARPEGHVYSDHSGFGYMCPEGIFHLLKWLHGLYPKKPIIVTEFGFADERDRIRPFLIMETFRWMVEAINAGVPLIGAYYWSPVQNFEWLEAMKQNFGIFKEAELNLPLIPRIDTEISSWEALKTSSDAILRPDSYSAQRFLRNRMVAKRRFNTEVKRRTNAKNQTS